MTTTERLPMRSAAVSGAAAPHRLYYGWLIALCAGLGLASSVAIFIPATIGLMVAPLGAEFHWSAQAIFLAPAFATTSVILIAPFMGAIVDRYGPRRVITISFVIEAAIMASFHFLDASLWLFYARYAAFALLASGTTHVAFAGLVSRWFDRRRGLALGIALGGFGLGGVFWSLVANALFDRMGWRDAFPAMAMIIMLVTLPIMFFVIRDTPQKMGLNVDGDSNDAATASASRLAQLGATGMSLREAARTPHYWLMIVTFCLVAFSVQSVMLHMVPYLTARGESRQTAALISASLWAVLLVGRVSTGWLLDRYFAPRIGFAFLVLPVVGVALLASGASGALALVCAMAVGLAAGSEVDVVAYLAGRYFGLKHYSMIYATFFSAFSIGAGLGPPFTAWAVARLGGYPPVLWIIAALMTTAAALLWTLPRYAMAQPHNGAAAAH